jgi:hypothetical protein
LLPVDGVFRINPFYFFIFLLISYISVRTGCAELIIKSVLETLLGMKYARKYEMESCFARADGNWPLVDGLLIQNCTNGTDEAGKHVLHLKRIHISRAVEGRSISATGWDRPLKLPPSRGGERGLMWLS